jgi:hypothetical protein
MEAEEREEFLKRSGTLRQELKVWEREFAAANGERKAGRDDIKKHPSIGRPMTSHELSHADMWITSAKVQRL